MGSIHWGRWETQSKTEIIMTRKDFLLIAETIRQLQGLTNIQRRAVAEQFAQKLKGTNPNFDGKRFVAACMGEG